METTLSGMIQEIAEPLRISSLFVKIVVCLSVSIFIGSLFYGLSKNFYFTLIGFSGSMILFVVIGIFPLFIGIAIIAFCMIPIATYPLYTRDDINDKPTTEDKTSTCSTITQGKTSTYKEK